MEVDFFRDLSFIHCKTGYNFSQKRWVSFLPALKLFYHAWCVYVVWLYFHSLPLSHQNPDFVRQRETIRDILDMNAELSQVADINHQNTKS